MRTKPKPRRSSRKQPKRPEKRERQSTPPEPAEATARKRAKLFWTGRSQAVRLPKEFRFEGQTVLVSRDGNRVILEPDLRWPEGYIEWLRTGPLGDDFEIPPDPPIRPVDIF